MHRLSNAWRLSKASWQVLAQDKRMIGIPILAALAAIVAFAVIALPGLLLVGDRGSSAGDLARWILVALGAIAASWCAAFGQAAIIAGAAEIMDGDAPSLRVAVGTARRRSFRLLEWAVLATGVALILDQIEQRFGSVGRIVSWLGGAAFAVLSFLALPVIVFENLGAVAAFKRSAVLLKQTWGEQVAFGFGMGLLAFVLVLPAALVGLLGLSTGLLPLQLFGLAAAAAGVVLILAVTSAMSAVFKTALYRYATGAPVDHAFTDADLANAFEPAKGSDASRPTPFAEPDTSADLEMAAESGAVATMIRTAEPLACLTIGETEDAARLAMDIEPTGAVTSSDVPRLVTMVDEIVEHAKAAKATKAAKTARTRKPAKSATATTGSDTDTPAKATKATTSAKATKATKAAKATKATKTSKASKSAKATKTAKSRKSTKKDTSATADTTPGEG